MKLLTDEDVRRLLRKAAGANRARWCSENLVLPSYLADVLAGRRGPGPSILNALGLERVTVYRETERNPDG